MPRLDMSNGEWIGINIPTKHEASSAFIFRDENGKEILRLSFIGGKVVDIIGDASPVLLARLTRTGVVRVPCGHNLNFDPYHPCSECRENP